METCAIDGCTSPVFVKSRGWCKKHYTRWHRTGDPLKAAYERADGSPLERWWQKVNKDGPSGCWLWTGGVDRGGYGQFDVIIDGKHTNHRAHRWGYEQLVRPLAADEPLDHLCRVHACVNPDHLEPVTHQQNVNRGVAGEANASKTHCPQGHAYDEVNTYVSDRGGRQCRTCMRATGAERTRRFRERQRDGTVVQPADRCRNGHEFTEANTYRPPRGGRQCRECTRERTRDHMRRKRAEAKAVGSTQF